MRSSDLLLALLLAGSVRADNLTLADDAQLTGTVRSINAAGLVELTSTLSAEPLLLKPGAVAKVEFSSPAAVAQPPGTLIELTNGDLLPAAVVSLDGESLDVLTPDAGPLTIPRGFLKSMQFGVHQRKIVYAGPKNAEEWIREGGGPKTWTYTDKALTADGPAYASKSFELPLQFILKFTLKWQANPSFQIYFADPLTPKTDPVDRYYLQFNAAGLEIKREASEGQHFRTVMLLGRTPENFPANQVDVEIRVDRKTSRLHLMLNGEPEGAGVDPVGKPPTGNGISLVTTAPAGSTQEIRGIEIGEFDNTRVRHRAEDRGDLNTDSLISRDDDRWSGRLTRIAKGPDGPVFLFKSDFQEAPLELSEADVSTIFFARSEPAPAAGQVHPFALRLRGEGLLRVESCTFAEDGVTARHPLLGALKISRAGVAALEHLEPQTPLKPSE